MTSGVSNSDFAQILADMGVTVSYEVVTKTDSAQTGEETDTYAAATNQTVIFFLEEQKWVWDKAGLIEHGDAYIIAPTSLNIKRYDQFTYDSQKYIIDSVLPREVLGVSMSDYGVCFKVE